MTREQGISKQCERILEILGNMKNESRMLQNDIKRTVEIIDDYLQMPCGCGCDCKHLKRCPHSND